MASVTLTRVWFHEADDLSENITVRNRPISGQTSAAGEVRTYAGGRKRIIRRAGVEAPLEFEARNIGRTEFQWLQDRLGTTLFLRDPHGRRHWGVIWSLPWAEWPFAADELASAELSFHPISWTEAV